MSEDAAAEWNRVMPILTDRRILTDADLGSRKPTERAKAVAHIPRSL